MSDPLLPKLRALQNKHPHLKEFADKLEAAVNDYSEGSAKRLLGCWARARRAYCAITGEDLI